ncbi:uncharacterized protein EDB91DRAFT_1251241 [Suillus paluster]|uniref:uncharacterized protein n=1 Tax=Suillus paluster TaxID=48578 RepID=UPI001B85D41C|nr:uncharacterized protein EDB91DRAFT_1251241 [Suillus paluster]KAG1733576.1 hypothetical protein EDB91DRAFT_1251241 [Suillus paluster]
MTSPPHSPPPQKVASNEPENDNPSSPPVSPKRSFAFTDEADRTPASLGYFKRRHVHDDGEAAKRAPLGKFSASHSPDAIALEHIVNADPLSASEIDNRPENDPRWSEAPFHSLATTAPELRSCDANHSIPINGTGDEITCSWPPAIKSGDADSTAGSSRRERPPLTRGGRYSSDAQESVRASAAGSASAWPPPLRSRSDLSSPERRTSSRGWDVDKVTQSIRSRTPSVPYVRRPPRDLWKAASSSNDPVRTVYGLVDDRDSIFDTSPPPGITRRRGSVPDLTGPGSWSLSLASGSQPLRADESPKSVPPIGAERSRVVSMTPRRSRSLPPAGLQLPKPSEAHDSSRRNYSRLNSNATLHDTCLLGDPRICGVLEKSAFDLPIDRDEFFHLLRQAVHNKHFSRVFSPLNPLRNPRPSSSLTANPIYQRFMPSLLNRLSPRYAKGPDKRLRTLCELIQPPFAIEYECTHCQECKRDTIRKRLLARNYRCMRLAPTVLTTPLTCNPGPPSSSRPYNIDEDEKSLWEEVAAATSTEPFPGSPRLRDLHDFDDDNEDDDYPEIPDEDLLSGGEDVKFGMGKRLLAEV